MVAIARGAVSMGGRESAALRESSREQATIKRVAGANARLAYPFTTDDSCALRFELAQGKVRAIDVSCHMN